MKLFRAALIISALLLCGVVNGYADRLYTWTDAKGVTHITQDPPPNTAKVVDTIDYSPQQTQSLRRPTAGDRTNQPQGNLNQGGGPSGRGSGSGFVSGDESKDVQYDGDSYRRTLLRYETKHQILDNNEPDKGGDLPPRPKPRPRKR